MSHPAITQVTRKHGMSIAAQLGWLADMNAFVGYLCTGTAHPTLMQLAVHELAANAIRHGRASRIRLDFDGTDAGWRLVLSDDGGAFDPMARAPRALGELREGGYGISIVQRVLAGDPSVQFAFRRMGAWNHYEFRHHFPASALEVQPGAPRSGVDVMGWL